MQHRPDESRGADASVGPGWQGAVPMDERVEKKRKNSEALSSSPEAQSKCGITREPPDPGPTTSLTQTQPA